ncbi:hypothetical protein ACH5RR_014872 [Cinchona calisaya]|uniref:CID domain-containing protein n=1 Tax=Cinchona calisaya TaxID=153742 RepID=A0ABD2ZSP8_9GENT
MVDARFENPGAFIGGGVVTSNRAMENGVVLKPLAPPTILDKFRAMLKEREVRVSEDNVVFLSTEEVVRIYEVVLSELRFNLKPIITDLTIIAGEQIDHGEGIADAICARIIEVPVEQKLPSLYLLDSIVKNIGREYVKYFSARLPEVFCEAYRQVHPNMHPSMRHLFRFWSNHFSPSVLQTIEARLQFSPSLNNQSSSLNSVRASESSQPTHGIHVRQFVPTSADANVQPGRGSTSKAKIYGQKPATGYDEYNSDNAELNPSGDMKAILSSDTRIARSSSPYGVKRSRSLSPFLDDIAMDASSSRASEKASPSHSGFDYGVGRISGRHEEASDGPRNTLTNDTCLKSENPANRYRNGLDLQGPRALIEAYGIDERQKPLSHKHLKVDHPNVNGIHKSASLRTWQNTEEEEFNWEDMSSTLGDSSQSNDLLTTATPPPASFRTRAGFGRHPDAPFATSDIRSNWPNQAQRPIFSDSSQAEDVSAISSVREVTNKIPGFRYEKTQVPCSQFTQDGFNMPQTLVQSSQHHFNIKGSGRNLPIPFSGTGMASSVEQKPPLIANFPNSDTRNQGPSTVVSRFSPSGFDSLTPEIRSVAKPASTGLLASVKMHGSCRPTSLTSPPIPEKIGYQPNTVGHLGMNMSSFPGQRLGSIESKSQNNMPQFPNQHRGLIPLNQQVRAHVNLQPPQPLISQEVRLNMVPPVSVVAPCNLVRPLNQGYVPQAQGNPLAMSMGFQNLIHGVQLSVHAPSTVNASLHLPGVAMARLPQGLPPISSSVIPITQNPGSIGPNPLAGGALSGLFNSLMTQGLISLTKEASMQDSVVLDFNPDTLKVRHEWVITAIYADLPRQCTTCGLRFKCQEAHSSHMDWHVKRNRKSKNPKQKPFCNWFVNVDMWLSGAEALGADTVRSFLPAENLMEKNDDEEIVVPADEDQKVCALCGEPFDEFYSDETEEWMYRGTVYMNAPTGSTAGMDRSQLGPIIHAKCRSETSVASAEDLR